VEFFVDVVGFNWVRGLLFCFDEFVEVMEVMF